MMSVLLLTLLLAVHSQPVAIGRMSLLPVVNVVGSLVLNELSAFVPKSGTNTDALKPAGGGVILPPDELNSELQSTVCVLPPTLVVVLATTSPSSWNVRSWTALAGWATTTIDPTSNAAIPAARQRARP